MNTVAIIGGGLAGIASALRLVEHGYKPILIESKKRLGGRATSLVDPRSGHTIDNCQHVLLGCCTNLIDFYSRLNVLDQIEWHRTLYWTRGHGEIDTMKAGWLPAPLHLSGSFHRMRMFSASDKRHIARAMLSMIRMGFRARLAWANRTFAEYLQACGQPDELVRSFWDTIIVSACNMNVQRVNAAHALHVFQEGFLANKFSYSMGLATVPLADLYAPAIDFIIENGGDIQLGESAKSIAFDGSRVTGVITETGVISCAAVISAVPFDRLEKLTSATLRLADKRLQSLDQIEVSPILGVHLRFDQEIMKLPHLVLVDPPSGVQWLFNKGISETGADGDTPSTARTSQHLHAVISAADEWMSLDEDEIVNRVMADVHFALPNSRGLQPIEARSIKEKRATFAGVPGIDTVRPGAAVGYSGGVRNLFLAGDWTDTGWPATMEGAVRSGYAAAGAIIGQDLVIEDIPSGFLARILGLR